MNFDSQLSEELDRLRSGGALRRLARTDYDGKYAFCDGVRMLNFSGNDYLGVASDSALHEEFFASLGASGGAGLSAASSRLLTGNSHDYDDLEFRLSEMYGGRAALVFNSGYHANIGILPALAGKGDIVFSDKLNHASIIDGLRLGEAEYKRYTHGDLASLEKMLQAAAGKYRNTFIVSESIFSMDGDIVSPAALAELKKRYNAMLVIDEAHAFGLFGPRNGGIADLENCVESVDVLIGTFGKAAGSVGAFAVTTPAIREYLVNRMRSLIFSTGLPPLNLKWTSFVLDKLTDLSDRRERLGVMAKRLREILRAKGFATNGETHIVPAIVGENTKALELADKLRRSGFLTFAIRPPTVPPGTARLRFSLSGAMDMTDIDALEATL